MKKYGLTSKRQKDGNINHKCFGEVSGYNESKDPTKQFFEEGCYVAQRIISSHEELMIINPEVNKIKTTMIEKPEKSFLARLVMAIRW
jgi:hypothetical protein